MLKMFSDQFLSQTPSQVQKQLQGKFSDIKTYLTLKMKADTSLSKQMANNKQVELILAQQIYWLIILQY